MKITSELFHKVKKELHWYTRPLIVALRNNISYKTVLQIRSAKNFQEYREICESQHPITKFSLREEVLLLHRVTFDRHDNAYLAPRTAKKAIAELLTNV